MVKSVFKELELLVIIVAFLCYRQKTKKNQQFVENCLKCKVNFSNYYCQIQKRTVKYQKPMLKKILKLFQLEIIYKMSTQSDSINAKRLSS